MLPINRIAIFASRTVSSGSVLRCYDWATEQKQLGRCVVSGFHSKLEKDVLHFLLKTKTPTILVLGRSPYKKLPKAFQQAVDEGLLQIISVSNAPRQTEDTSRKRNEHIISLADEIVFASLNEQSSLYPLYMKAKTTNKPITLL